MDDKASLDRAKQKSDALKQVINSVGWRQHIQPWLEDKYMESFKEMRDTLGKRDAAAGAMSIVDGLFNEIGTSIDWGERAKEKLRGRISKNVESA